MDSTVLTSKYSIVTLNGYDKNIKFQVGNYVANGDDILGVRFTPYTLTSNGKRHTTIQVPLNAPTFMNILLRSYYSSRYCHKSFVTMLPLQISVRDIVILVSFQST